jgi:hypothetical protein
MVFLRRIQIETSNIGQGRYHLPHSFHFLYSKKIINSLEQPSLITLIIQYVRMWLIVHISFHYLLEKNLIQ